MIKNSTLTGKYLLLLTIAAFATISLSAQSAPKLKFRQPQLISGVAKQLNAVYMFPNVMPGVDAYVQIENIVNGAYLVNIDDSTLGYYDAWQPTVGGNGLYGPSYIKWDIQFKDKSGKKYKFSILNASAIDIDGDNVRVREFIGVNGQSSFDTSVQVPNILTLNIVDDTDDINNDKSKTNLIALGPVANRAGIDTASQDVRVNFRFDNTDEFHLYTGSQVDSNGTTDAIATDRYHCIYFMKIVSTLSVLPVRYENFSAMAIDRTVDLNWSINAELENHQFEIQRSYDQTNFSTIAYVLGPKNTNNGNSNFSYRDKSADFSSGQVIYYRLVQTDANQKLTYSVVKMVRTPDNSTLTKLNIQVLPNPYLDRLIINFVSNSEGNGEIMILNTAGYVVKRVKANLVKGYNNLQVQDLGAQAPGMYVMNLVANGKIISTEKIIKN